jgi:hypothetical protein
MSNAYATVEAVRELDAKTLVSTAIFGLFLVTGAADAQPLRSAAAVSGSSGTQRATTVGLFLAGAAIGLGAHEGGHLLFDVLFDADPGVRRVDFHGIPFFAITHRNDLPPGKEFTISSAGFWVQHLTNEWVLTTRPGLRQEKAPLLKGLVAFNVLASGAYAGAAFFKTGPTERDTRGMADSSHLDERWIGLVVLAPAVFDSWRYFRPDSQAATWLSRAAKIGGVLLTVRAATR